MHSCSPQSKLRKPHLIIVAKWRTRPLSEERKRTKYDIYADVIEMVAKKDLCSLTRISYGANMPVDRAKKVVSFLVSHGFMREVDVGDHRKYRVTKWGMEYLETFKRMRKFFAALEEHSSNML
jgi:predicted transcriptional regulator